MGNAADIINDFKLKRVVFNCGNFNELEQKLINNLKTKKIPFYSCLHQLNLGKNKLSFLNSQAYNNENDNSSVVYTKIYAYKFLFLGDISTTVEEELIKKYNLQEITVLKVGHHGSKTSTSKNFIAITKPKYSVISVGQNNRYNHPNEEVLKTLNDSKIYRTDIDGTILFKLSKNKMKIKTYPS